MLNEQTKFLYNVSYILSNWAFSHKGLVNLSIFFLICNYQLCLSSQSLSTSYIPEVLSYSLWGFLPDTCKIMFLFQCHIPMETGITLPFIACFWEQLPNHHRLKIIWLVMPHQVGLASGYSGKYVLFPKDIAKHLNRLLRMNSKITEDWMVIFIYMQKSHNWVMV